MAEFANWRQCDEFPIDLPLLLLERDKVIWISS
jgi:hypothetical protein